ncbi:uncharacterized protein BDZ99DRAFT_533412 [Mytilinidion resinicola]|uniref:Protein kinase domain-containing protein n=1 Tax=Mytilinidion resinicola TaxID=574789 RepID=A0A6A6YJK3_9PEZI|nr:uncharacterized protein BDZ99DRAFT_533412 [Mytilinidion resinicola]KAF2809036.1 hypothetical protein BDZ99DRAFT_533412 [Mytilinidion resinicola]
MSRPKYHIASHTTSLNDDDCEIIVRSNGKIFYLHISPSDFQNPPAATAYYRECLEVMKTGEELIDGPLESDFYDWIMPPFETLIADLAPATASALEKARGGRATLHDYLFLEWFVCRLEAFDKTLRSRRVHTQRSGHMPPGVRLDVESLRDLATWAVPFHPSEVELSFDQPDDALFKHPEKVLVHNSQTAYFFKLFHPGALRSSTLICRLHGVVQDEEGFLIDMLLTYIDYERKKLGTAIRPDTPLSLRQHWATQVTETLTGLHRSGVVWGNAKVDNVLIDTENNAWIVDFGGSYTEGWVDKETSGTVEGDLQALEKIVSFVLT